MSRVGVAGVAAVAFTANFGDATVSVGGTGVIVGGMEVAKARVATVAGAVGIFGVAVDRNGWAVALAVGVGGTVAFATRVMVASAIDAAMTVWVGVADSFSTRCASSWRDRRATEIRHQNKRQDVRACSLAADTRGARPERGFL